MHELCWSRPCREGLSPWKQANSCVVERPQRIVSVSTHALTAQYYTILLHTVEMQKWFTYIVSVILKTGVVLFLQYLTSYNDNIHSK